MMCARKQVPAPGGQASISISSPNSSSSHRNMRLMAALATLTLALGAAASADAQGGAAANSCHLRELDLCAASMLVFTQAPGGLATTDAEIGKQCAHLMDADGCLRNYTRRCMTPVQRELMSFAANSSLELLDEYCTKGSKVRQSYLKHAQCLNQLQKKQEHKTCMRDLQSSLELLTASSFPSSAASSLPASGPKPPNQKLDPLRAPAAQSETNGKRLQLACCAYRRFESCLGGQMEKRCGKETLQFVQTTIRRATSRLPETVCRHFKPDGPECRALLPKPGAAIPRGSKSNSIISRLLSAYTGGL